MSSEIPVQKAIMMKSQGMANDKIIEALLSEKYTYQQIRDALQQAEIKKNVSNPGQAQEEAQAQEMPKEESMAPQAEPSAPSQNAPQPAAPRPMMQASAPRPMPSGINIDEIQRILEEIINEKWKESEEAIVRILEWKAGITAKMADMESRMKEFNSRIDSMNLVLGKKAEEFNMTMTNVDTEIKALDKALNKLIPALSDNISELKDALEKK